MIAFVLSYLWLILWCQEGNSLGMMASEICHWVVKLIMLPMQGSAAADPVVSKYIASGLNREAVPLAVANFGDNPTKVFSFSFCSCCLSISLQNWGWGNDRWVEWETYSCFVFICCLLMLCFGFHVYPFNKNPITCINATLNYLS